MDKRTLLDRLISWQQRVMDDFSAGHIIKLGGTIGECDADEEADAVRYCLHSHYPPPSGAAELESHTRRRDLGRMPRLRSIIVGLDVRGYSNRPDEEQVFLTLALHAAVTRALELLRNVGIIPQEEPLIILERGDGAFLIFSFLDTLRPDDVFSSPDQLRSVHGGHSAAMHLRESKAGKASEETDQDRALRSLTEEQMERQRRSAVASADRDAARNREARLLEHLPIAASFAFSFIFALNALIEQSNRHRGFRSKWSSPASPRTADIPPRALPLELRYAVSYDDILLLRDVNSALNAAGRGIVTCGRMLSADSGGHLLVQESLLDALMLCNGLDNVCGGAWGHTLHRAQLPPVKIKSGSFAYADLFGFHYDYPLLAALGRQDLPPVRYHIGSHDVGSLAR